MACNVFPAPPPGGYPLDHRRGWFVVIGAFLVQFVVFGMQASFPVFINSFSKDDSLGNPTRTQVGVVNSLATGPGLLLGCLGGIITDKYGIRPPLISVVMCFAFALVATALFAHSWEAMVGLYSIPSTVTIGFANAPVQASVGTWFDRKLGLAMGIATAGGGVGSALVPLLTGQLVSKMGWRSTFLVLTVFDLLVIIAAVLSSKRDPTDLESVENRSFIRSRSHSILDSARYLDSDTSSSSDDDDRGDGGDRDGRSSALDRKKRTEAPDGGKTIKGYGTGITDKDRGAPHNKEHQLQQHAQQEHHHHHHHHHEHSLLYFAKELFVTTLLTKSFIILFFAGIFFGYAYTGTLFLVIPLALEYGKGMYATATPVDVATASTLFVGFGFAQAAGGFICGEVGDRLGAKIVYGLVSVVAAVGTLLMGLCQGYATLFVAFCLIGGCYCGNWAMYPAMISERFPPETLGLVMGIAYASVGVGALAGPPLSSVLVELEGGGNYPLALASIAISMCISGGLCFLLLPSTVLPTHHSPVPASPLLTNEDKTNTGEV